MYKKSAQGWMKHWDFLILEIISLQLAYFLAFYLYQDEMWNPYYEDFYRGLAIVMILCQILVVFFSRNFSKVLKRGYYNEFKKTMEFSVAVIGLTMIYVYITKQAEFCSRGTMLLTLVFYTIISFLFRAGRKYTLIKHDRVKKIEQRVMFLITDQKSAARSLEKLFSHPYEAFQVKGIVMADGCDEAEINGIPVVATKENMFDYICREWVDEVVIALSSFDEISELLDEFMMMGITVHIGLPDIGNLETREQHMEKIGSYPVITTSIHMTTPIQSMLKRMLDIAGGLVGCLMTLLLILIIGPMIYIQSPGPIFFSQLRIGKNGRKFKIYKFRSMYMDAEERKAELMKQNKVKDGHMFKMDNDPRIIGSSKVRKDGTPGGIGNFIRRTSLDEFPQFWNVLKGDMSLVGTRPPTVDEWEHYDKHHRARMAIKPGITGMWQVSGRSEITDFEEVVKLDTTYIKNWTIGLDLKILVQTVVSVLKGEGAE